MSLGPRPPSWRAGGTGYPTAPTTTSQNRGADRIRGRPDIYDRSQGTGIGTSHSATGGAGVGTARNGSNEGGRVSGSGPADGRDRGQVAPTHRPPLAQTSAPRRRKKKKRKMGHLKVATLNMRGANGRSTEFRWDRLVPYMKKNGIAIIALQETHSTDARIAKLKKDHPEFLFYHSSDTGRPNSKGVAFVINTFRYGGKILKVENIEAGRCLMITIEWHENQTLSIMVVYAPNPVAENRAFWDRITTHFQSDDNPGEHREHFPDLVLGDFNMVESPRDRRPASAPCPTLALAFMRLKAALHLRDEWRHHHPEPERLFTYSQNSNGPLQSRLDRVYFSETIQHHQSDWGSDITPIDGLDHDLVWCKLYHRKAPHIGDGRWAMPVELLKDRKFKHTLNELGGQLERDLADTNDSQAGTPQKLFQEFLRAIRTKARDILRVNAGKIGTAIKRLEAEYETLSARQDLTADDAPEIERTLAIKERIQELRLAASTKRYLNNTTLRILTGETMNANWCKRGKAQKPRDVITRMKDDAEGHEPYATRSDKIADAVAGFFDRLQRLDLERDGAARDEATERTLRHVTRVTAEEAAELEQTISRENIIEALKHSPNGKAPGLNGIPAELYKSMHDRWLTTKDLEKDPAPDIVGILQRVYNDIEENGVTEKEFSEGWICPIWKGKGDQSDPSNFRPITVLNVEYKIMTTAIMFRLGKVISRLIANNQAAFIPGRSIFNHIDLVKRLIEYAETTETNGMILSLDQEKAYDRIRHDYLWKLLEKAGMPEGLIRTIRALYTGARSQVIVNGERSYFFEVTRGTRQGDPLSCIIFLLAIEPMSKMIQECETLTGFSIKSHDGMLQRLILALFADDSTAFLNENDNVDDLFTLLDTWCLASGAKFNVPKTKAIPIGTVEFRDRVLETRKMNDQNEIRPTVQLIPDGTALRVLGAHVGNGIPDDEGWTEILEKIDKALAQWERAWPTLTGRRLIIQMVIGGMTQFKTRAQGMPKTIEKALRRTRREFFWNSEGVPPVSAQHVNLPVGLGGWDLLDVQERNKAIELMKARDLINFTKSRPIWADLVMEIILAITPASEPGERGDTARTDIFRQTLYQRTRYLNEAIPPDIRRMLNAIRQHDLLFDTEALTQAQRQELPIWMHIGTQGRNDLGMPRMRCLRERHGVRTAGDMQLQQALGEDEPHQEGDPQCECDPCKRYREAGCENPDACYRAAGRRMRRMDTKFDPWEPDVPPEPPAKKSQRRREHVDAQEEDNNRVEFDPRTYAPRSIGDAFRIFATKERTSAETPQDVITPEDFDPTEPREREVTVWTDGSCLENGDENARAGYGVWFGPDDPRNEGERVNEELVQSNNTGEMLAILRAGQKAHGRVDLTIKSDSRWAIQSLTESRRRNEDNGYIGTQNSTLIRATVATLRQRTGRTTLEWVKGHADDEGNNEADRLAGEGALREANTQPANLEIPDSLDISGARLTTATQALLHAGIKKRSRAKVQPRARAIANLERAREAVWEHSGRKPTNAQIWKANRRRKEIRPNVQAFIWKALQGAHKIGSYWTKIPGYEHRGRCARCDGAEETMEHILFQCPANQGKSVWKTAKEICRAKRIAWPENFYTGHIYASNLLEHKSSEGQKRPGAQRLFTIVITECAFVIWKMRNDRVIEHADDEEPYIISPQEAANRTLAAIDLRFNVDRLSTNVYKLGKKALSKKIVLNTWKGTLANEDSLPDDWIKADGVLVGMACRRPPGRNR